MHKYMYQPTCLYC